jgi:hypothetical protein
MHASILSFFLACTSFALTGLASPAFLQKRYSTRSAEMTFYGWPDNDPPSADTAYDCGYGRGYTAGGTGSFSNPLTAAVSFSNSPSYKKCEIVYSVYLRKYLIIQDECAGCSGTWLDVWVGGSANQNSNAIIQCEDHLTPSSKKYVNLNPGPRLSRIETIHLAKQSFADFHLCRTIYYPFTSSDSSLPVDTRALWDGTACTGHTY